MAEYIERKVVINRIKEYTLDVYDIDLDDAKQFGGNIRIENYCEGLYEATELVDDIPAADVAQVVRCKNCTHYKIVDEFEGGKRYMCKVNHFSYINSDGDIHYCSYGERKEDKSE